MVELPYDGDVYALSLDFNEAQLEQIISKATPELAVFLVGELKRDPNTPRTIDFVGEISFTVRARLGEIQQAQKELFVPLIAQEIM
jgi:hypothetical protein